MQESISLIWFGIGLMIAFFLGMLVSNLQQFWYQHLARRIRKEVEYDKNITVKEKEKKEIVI